MDRRTAFNTLTGRHRAQQAAPPPKTLTGLAPYTGPWGFEQAAHLLRRSTFGPTWQQIKTAEANGLAATVAQLLAEPPQPAAPVNYYFANDPFVPVGETWVNAPYSLTVNLRQHRNRSFQAWTMQNMLEEGISVREQMTLFWHNHFAIESINDPRFVYRYIALLRSHSLGNFRDLVKAVTIDPTMLRYLNGNQSTRLAPNENYARELLELFTIGKGDQIGPGDYTHYTEQDVEEMARVLTGWRDRGFNTLNPELPIESYFTVGRHDIGTKQLSHRFGNVTISNMGDQEYAHLIDLVFQQDEVARFLSRKLYRWFVYYDIDAAAEAEVIQPMAELLIASDYNVKPVLEALLRSEHFFDALNLGPMIKAPLVFIMSAFRQGHVSFPSAFTDYYNALRQVFTLTTPMEQQYYQLPSVAGWKAYYQAPLYYRTWINASTLRVRMGFTDTVASNGFLYAGQRIVIRPLPMIADMPDIWDPNAVIDNLVRLLFPQPITEAQLAALKGVFLPGLPDEVWTTEYTNYLANPTNPAQVATVENRLKGLIRVMMSMPEFYLC